MCDDVVITILKEHEEKYDIIRGIHENLGDVKVVTLPEPTKSQSETVYRTLKAIELYEPFMVKDCDNVFSIKIPYDKNYVCYSDLHELAKVDSPGGKSYIQMGENDIIQKIAEKNVISRYFNVGGYYFLNPALFIRAFEDNNKENGEMYISHIISYLMKNDVDFYGRKVTGYIDWGTKEMWEEYKRDFKTLFVDLDGVVFQNSAQFFKPRWEDSKPIEKNVAVLRKMSENPKIEIVFVTARSEKYRNDVETRLKALGIKYKTLIMGLFHAKRVMVNDFSSTAKYPTCEAVNIMRNSEDLEKYII